jgi:methylmalonyl-CoA/ethylmalonyl-CoA epimerase
MMKVPASIARLGDIMQMAYVPRNLEGALKYWTQTMGAGPFFTIDHVKLERVRYLGEPADIDFSIVLGYWGDMQIELIKQHNDAPSIFKAWRDQGGEGLHHVCLLVDDMTAVRSICDSNAIVAAQEALVPGGGEVVYLNTMNGPASYVEVLKPAPGTSQFFKMMREAHRTWDGNEPVRRLG